MTREPEAWGGEIRLPHWLRRLVRRPERAESTPEARHEARRSPGEMPERHDQAIWGGLRDKHAGSRPRPSQGPGSRSWRRPPR
jgi:hypothetical protein